MRNKKLVKIDIDLLTQCLIRTKDNKIVNGIPILSKLNNNQDITWMGNTTHAHFKSLSFVWLNQLTTKNMQYPKEYSQTVLSNHRSVLSSVLVIQQIYPLSAQMAAGKDPDVFYP